MTQLAELLRRQAALNQEISALRLEGRRRAIDEVLAVMAAHDLTVDDLASKRPSSTKSRGGKSAKRVAAKYRDPANGTTWSGRGLTPKWLAAKLAEGKSKEEFAV